MSKNNIFFAKPAIQRGLLALWKLQQMVQSDSGSDSPVSHMIPYNNLEKEGIMGT